MEIGLVNEMVELLFEIHLWLDRVGPHKWLMG